MGLGSGSGLGLGLGLGLGSPTYLSLTLTLTLVLALPLPLTPGGHPERRRTLRRVGRRGHHRALPDPPPQLHQPDRPLPRHQARVRAHQPGARVLGQRTVSVPGLCTPLPSPSVCDCVTVLCVALCTWFCATRCGALWLFTHRAPAFCTLCIALPKGGLR